MKRVEMVYSFDENNEYFGGIATILSAYSSSKAIFSEEGYDISWFNGYKHIGKIKTSPKTLAKRLYLWNVFYNELVKKDIGHIEVLHFHTSRRSTLLLDLLTIARIRKHFSGKIVVTIHYVDIDKIFLRNRLVRRLCIDIIGSYVDGLVVLADKAKKEFIKLGISGSKIHVLYTFSDMTRSDGFLPSEREQDQGIRILFVGSIDKRKGIMDLLLTLKNVQIPYQLHICGKICDETIQEEFESMVKNNKKISLIGYVSGDEKYQEYEWADVLVLPSYGEGMPIVIMEAFTMGCAVIATNVGGIPEIIDEGVNGYLINPGDKITLAHRIEELANDDELLSKVKRNALLSGTRFITGENVKQLCDIYKKL